VAVATPALLPLTVTTPASPVIRTSLLIPTFRCYLHSSEQEGTWTSCPHCWDKGCVEACGCCSADWMSFHFVLELLDEDLGHSMKSYDSLMECQLAREWYDGFLRADVLRKFHDRYPIVVLPTLPHLCSLLFLPWFLSLCLPLPVYLLPLDHKRVHPYPHNVVQR
jgi:hypothetical protein